MGDEQWLRAAACTSPREALGHREGHHHWDSARRDGGCLAHKLHWQLWLLQLLLLLIMWALPLLLLLLIQRALTLLTWLLLRMLTGMLL